MRGARRGRPNLLVGMGATSTTSTSAECHEGYDAVDEWRWWSTPSGAWGWSEEIPEGPYANSGPEWQQVDDWSQQCTEEDEWPTEEWQPPGEEEEATPKQWPEDENSWQQQQQPANEEKMWVEQEVGQAAEYQLQVNRISTHPLKSRMRRCPRTREEVK